MQKEIDITTICNELKSLIHTKNWRIVSHLLISFVINFVKIRQAGEDG